MVQASALRPVSTMAATPASIARPLCRPAPKQRQLTTRRRDRVFITAAAGGAGAKTATKVYICKDCGWIYDGRQSFDELPSSYKCPVCQAPRRRFGPYSKPVGAKPNSKAAVDERYAQLQKGGGSADGGGQTAVVVTAAGIVALAVLYFALNSQFN